VTFTGTSVDVSTRRAFVHFRDAARRAFAGTGLRLGFTGGVATTEDLIKSSERDDKLVAVATIVLIVVMLLLIFRGPLAVLVALLSVFLVSSIATGLITLMAKAFDMPISLSVPSLLTVVLFGVGTDYAVFLFFRVRERLRVGEDRRSAVAESVSRVGEAIASAALAVVSAFALLGISQFGQFQALGPAMAIAVSVMLVAGVTLVPAFTAIVGPALFWPSRSWRRPRVSEHGGLPALVASRPVLGIMGSLVVLGILSLAALQIRTTFDDKSSTSTPSTRAAHVMEGGFPTGASAPTSIFVRGSAPLTDRDMRVLSDSVSRVPRVGQVTPPTYSADRTYAVVNVYLKGSPTGSGAMRTVEGPLRDAAHRAAPPRGDVYVGGITSVLVDVDAAVSQDLRLIFPLAGLIILLILASLLRAVVAPVYLIVATVLGFGATLGAAVLLFQGLLGHHDVVFSLPLVAYLFVVALGTDYNILMVSRLREEYAEGRSPRQAVENALRHAGPAVASAGVILAGTFTALLFSEGSRELGFTLSLGILIMAFIVALVLVPSLTAVVGSRAWWPGRLSRADRFGDVLDEEELAAVGAPGPRDE
jgi:RND superfamily putative drug exporter